MKCPLEFYSNLEFEQVQLKCRKELRKMIEISTINFPFAFEISKIFHSNLQNLDQGLN